MSSTRRENGKNDSQRFAIFAPVQVVIAVQDAAVSASRAAEEAAALSSTWKADMAQVSVSLYLTILTSDGVKILHGYD